MAEHQVAFTQLNTAIAEFNDAAARLKARMLVMEASSPTEHARLAAVLLKESYGAPFTTAADGMFACAKSLRRLAKA